LERERNEKLFRKNFENYQKMRGPKFEGVRLGEASLVMKGVGQEGVDIETREGILLEIMAEKRIMIHDDT
jgi:hypothetical protein